MPESGLSPHARSARLRQAEGTLLPHWTRSTLRVAIAKSEKQGGHPLRTRKREIIDVCEPRGFDFCRDKEIAEGNTESYCQGN